MQNQSQQPQQQKNHKFHSLIHKMMSKMNPENSPIKLNEANSDDNQQLQESQNDPFFEGQIKKNYYLEEKTRCSTFPRQNHQKMHEIDDDSSEKILKSHEIDESKGNQIMEKELIQNVFKWLHIQQVFQRINRKSSKSSQKYLHLEKQIKEEIERLLEVEQEYTQLWNTNEKNQEINSKSKQNQWKLIIVRYKDKMEQMKEKLKQQRQRVCELENQVNSCEQKISRINHLNSMKFSKIDNLMDNLEYKQSEIQQLNLTIAQMDITIAEAQKKDQTITDQIMKINKLQKEIQSNGMITDSQNLHQLKRQIESLEVDILKRNLIIETNAKQLQNQKDELNQKVTKLHQMEKNMNNNQLQIQYYKKEINQLSQQHEKSICQLMQFSQQSQFKNEQIKLLNEQIDQQKQVTDLKDKYEITIAKYEAQIEVLNYRLQEAESMQKETQQKNTQTNFNDQKRGKSLANQLHLNLQEDFDLDFSVQNHHIETHQLEDPFENEAMQESSISHHNSILLEKQMSFEQSIQINARQKYLTTIQELTFQLSQAYEKINELGVKVEELEKQMSERQRKSHHQKIVLGKIKTTVSQVNDIVDKKSIKSEKIDNQKGKYFFSFFGKK